MPTSISDLNLYGLKFYDPQAPSAQKGFDAQSTADLQSNFLKLLVAQLQNQDPLNPLESAEMTSQLAQLNMVDGINTMNKTMSSLVSQLQMSDFMSQANTVGKSAMAASSTLRFDGTNPVIIGAQFETPVTDAQVKVTDPYGNIAYKANLGSMQAGITNILWDGLAANGSAYSAGSYRVEVTGKSGASTVSAQTLVASTVATVGRQGSDLMLMLADGRKIRSGDVVQWVLE